MTWWTEHGRWGGGADCSSFLIPGRGICALYLLSARVGRTVGAARGLCAILRYLVLLPLFLHLPRFLMQELEDTDDSDSDED